MNVKGVMFRLISSQLIVCNVDCEPLIFHKFDLGAFHR